MGRNNKVDALGICKGSIIEVKDKWRAMVSSAKKEHNKCASSHKKTGGGRQPEPPRGTTLKIIELFEEDPSFSGIFGGIDSGKPWYFKCLQTVEFPCNLIFIMYADQRNNSIVCMSVLVVFLGEAKTRCPVKMYT